MLLQHLVLGFELDLYAPEEFCMMYWCAASPYSLYKPPFTSLLQTRMKDSVAPPVAVAAPCAGL